MHKMIQHHLQKTGATRYSLYGGFFFPAEETKTKVALIATLDSSSFALISEHNDTQETYEYSYDEVYTIDLYSEPHSSSRLPHRIIIHLLNGKRLDLGITYGKQYGGSFVNGKKNDSSILKTPFQQNFGNHRYSAEINTRIINAKALAVHNYYADAKEEYKKILELDSLNLPGHIGEISMLLRLGKHKEANSKLAKATILFPKHLPTLKQYVAETYYAQGNYKEASLLFQPVYELIPTTDNFGVYLSYLIKAEPTQAFSLIKEKIDQFPGAFSRVRLWSRASDEEEEAVVQYLKEEFSSTQSHPHLKFITTHAPESEVLSSWSDIFLSLAKVETYEEIIEHLETIKGTFKEVQAVVCNIRRGQEHGKIEKLHQLQTKITFCQKSLSTDEQLVQKYSEWSTQFEKFNDIESINTPENLEEILDLIPPLSQSGEEITTEGQTKLLAQANSLFEKKKYWRAKRLLKKIEKVFGPGEQRQLLLQMIQKKQRRRRIIISIISILILGGASYYGWLRYTEYKLYQEDVLLYARTYPEGNYIEEAEKEYWHSIITPYFLVNTDELALRSEPRTRGKRLTTLEKNDTIFYSLTVGKRPYSLSINNIRRKDYYYKVNRVNYKYYPKGAWVFGGGVIKNFRETEEKFETYLEVFQDTTYVEEAMEFLENLDVRRKEDEELLITRDPALYLKEYPNGWFKAQADSLLWETIPDPKLLCMVRKTYIYSEPKAKAKRLTSVRKYDEVVYLMQNSSEIVTLEIDGEDFEGTFYKVRKGRTTGWIFQETVRTLFANAHGQYQEYLELLPSGAHRVRANRYIKLLEENPQENEE